MALKWLSEDAKIVWMRASRDRWKAICCRVGLQHSAANERWLYALCVMLAIEQWDRAAGNVQAQADRPCPVQGRLKWPSQLKESGLSFSCGVA
jgi:Domain of unknown function (DUF6362)